MSAPTVASLKREAARHWQAYQCATEHLSCGNAVAQQVSVRASEHARAFDAAMDALSALDPACPARRLVAR